MKFCEIDPDSSSPAEENFVHCSTHDLPAKHCGPDGDTPVCEMFARNSGCNCCRENYGKTYDDQYRKIARAVVSGVKDLAQDYDLHLDGLPNEHLMERVIHDLIRYGIIPKENDR
jgi:hypothetical protein